MHQRKTAKGYDLYEVMSALQKCIRRGLVDEALFWGVEMYVSGQAWLAWRRLKIIASEDVGPADTLAVVLVHALYSNWVAETHGKRGDGEGRLFFTHAVIALATAKKSRVVDNALMYRFTIHERADEYHPIPDYALDKHTAAGRRMGRGFAEFFDEGAKLANLGEVADPYYDLARAAVLAKKGVGAAVWRQDDEQNVPGLFDGPR